MAREKKPPRPDVEIGAVVRAERLKFKRKPEAEVSFPGESEAETDSHTERENLPDEVEAGVTYRDVRVRWRAGARFATRPLGNPEVEQGTSKEEEERNG
jgi:hypothetical protein